MRLINVDTLQLEYFADVQKADVRYAILSHRWEEEEVIYQDMISISDRPRVEAMLGFTKIKMCCQQAAEDNLQYAWVDTCCIDKSSSAELQEAINSMFQWYSHAAVCYAYLSDCRTLLSGRPRLSNSLWFTRGWTLQELLAPSQVIFYDQRWNALGTRAELVSELAEATNISRVVLESGLPEEHRPCIAEIMSWAKHRRTTRAEDRAYSLLGLFNVSMPLLYGEGERAFSRLQEEILRITDDQSIFAWSGVRLGKPSLLAQSPDQFPDISKVMQISNDPGRRKPHSITNEGITLEFEIAGWGPDIYLACLNVEGIDHSKREDPRGKIAILLKQIDNNGRYARIPGSVMRASIEHLDANSRMLAEPSFYFSDLAQIKNFRIISFQRRQVTVVNELKDSEVARYELTKPISVRLHLDTSSENHWSSLINSRCIKVSGCDYDPRTQTLSGRAGDYGRLGIIKIVRQIKPLYYFPIRWIGLGFDIDFLPVIVLKAGGWDSDCYKLMRSSGPLVCPKLITRRASYKLAIQEIQNGSGGMFSEDVVAVKKDSGAQEDHESVDLQVKIHVHTQDGVLVHVTLLIARPVLTEPWMLYLDIRDSRDILSFLPTIILEQPEAEDSADTGDEVSNLSVLKADGKHLIGQRKQVLFEDGRQRSRRSTMLHNTSDGIRTTQITTDTPGATVHATNMKPQLIVTDGDTVTPT